MIDREMGIQAARQPLGDLVIDAKKDGTITYLTRYGERWAALVPLDRVTPDVEDTTLVRTVEEHGESWAETRRIEVHRYATGDTEVHVTGWTDDVETGPRTLERAAPPATPGEVEDWLREYRADLAGDGFTPIGGQQ